MTRRALLHIGMNKTGTSSIQASFADYADADWRYMQLGPPNHSSVFAMAFLDKPPRNIVNNLRIQGVELSRADALKMIRAELARDARSVVVSGEGLSNNFRGDDPRAVVELFRGEVDELRCLAYLREPVGFAASNFQQVVRQTLPSDDFSRFMPRYRKRFGPWIRAAGAERVSLVPFDPAEFAGGDLLVDFARRVGLSEGWAAGHAQRRNDALSAEATALLFALQRRLGGERLAGRELVGLRQTASALRDFGQEKFALSPAALGAALDAEADDIAWVEARLGRALPSPKLDGRRAFDSAEEILDCAAAQGPALAVHLARAGHDARGAEADPAAALERLVHHFANLPQKRGMGARAKAWTSARLKT